MNTAPPDPATLCLFQQAAAARGPLLVLADENGYNAPWGLLPVTTTTVVSNRCDVAAQAKAAGYSSHFCDFDFEPAQHPATVLFRVSKEKPVTHHAINRAAQLLPVGGTLLLCGEKNDGIKTYASKAAQLFGGNADTHKMGTQYLVTLTKQATGGEPLDDADYSTMRVIANLNGSDVYSKPGQFGWQKIDQGSAFLADHFEAFFSKIYQKAPLRILDLGCGYGYLSLRAAALLSDAELVATDNNAAAIASCAHNFEQWAINGRVIAGDVGDTLEGRFDAIICNPPFHQGFSTSGDLTDRFLDTMQRRLASKGKALVVVNQFVPIEKKALGRFSKITQIDSNRSFKLLLLQL